MKSSVKVLKKIKKLSKVMSQVTFDDLVNYLAENLIDKKSRKNEPLIVNLIGGAASGKTTLAKYISTILTERGLSTFSFSTDDFLIGDRAYRRERFEDKDPTKKYDIDLLNKKVADIVKHTNDGVEVRIPKYNGKTGLAIAAGEENYPNIIKNCDVLVVEGDFDFVKSEDVLIFLHVSDTDRLNIRIKRDLEQRGEHNSEKIKENFRHRQFNQHFPYTLNVVKKADIVITTQVEEVLRFYSVYSSF